MQTARHWLSRLFRGGQRPQSAPEMRSLAEIDVWMQEAFGLHQAGALTKAEDLYRRILAQQPDNADALYLRGELAKRTGRVDAALEWIGKAAALKPEVALFHQELAALHQAAGELAQAAASYARVLELEPHNFDALMGLGLTRLELRQSAAATVHFQDALRRNPESLAAQVNLGSALQAEGRMEEAAHCFRDALQRDPHCVQALSNLAGLRIKRNDFDGARKLLYQALQIDPVYVEARMNMGIVLLKKDQPAEALRIFEDAVRSRPDLALGHYNLGRVYRRTGNVERAIESYREALRLDPASVEFLLDLGRVLQESGQLEEAIARYQEAVARVPGLSLAHLRLGYALESVGEFGQAMACYDRAIALKPDAVQNHVNRATLLLLLGDYARGWAEYEWRLREPFFASLHANFPVPQWDGSRLAGRSILVYAEQGLGDELMYASWLPELIAQAGHCVIDCEPRLESLYRRSFAQATVHGATQGEAAAWLRDAPAVEVKVPLASLPFRLRRTGQDFPAQRGYLKAAGERVAAWRGRLAALGPEPKIGLAWRGGVPKTGRALRSLDLEQFMPLLRQPFRFVSLQYGECRPELAALRQRHGIAIQHWQEAIDDFDETAALMNALDLVISVCTTTVHLGGALDRPVWVLAPLKPEARYGLRGDTMPWYPSVRLFRQQRLRDWDGVISRVAQELAAAFAVDARATIAAPDAIPRRES